MAGVRGALDAQPRGRRLERVGAREPRCVELEEALLERGAQVVEHRAHRVHRCAREAAPAVASSGTSSTRCSANSMQ